MQAEGTGTGKKCQQSISQQTENTRASRNLYEYFKVLALRHEHTERQRQRQRQRQAAAAAAPMLVNGDASKSTPDPFPSVRGSITMYTIDPTYSI